MNGLPILVRVAGRPVVLVGTGEAADAKRRLLERAGARVVADLDAGADAALAVIALEDADEAAAAIAAARARGMLVNAVDRPADCDFTLPAIVDRSPVLIAVSTGGVSAGLAAALRQALEAAIPATLGPLATALGGARERLRRHLPDGAARRRALGAALSPGGALDPLSGADGDAVARWLAAPAEPGGRIATVALRSADPDDLTLREARWLGQADRVHHAADAPPAVLDRARADAVRLVDTVLPERPAGLVVDLRSPP